MREVFKLVEIDLVCLNFCKITEIHHVISHSVSIRIVYTYDRGGA